MGICLYQYNPSEIYQRTRPGTGVESCCGARTYPAMDEPEMALVKIAYPDGAGGTDVVDEAHHTGRWLPRAQHDPFCPAHGGTPEPPPPPVALAELEAAHTAFVTLAEQYHRQAGAPAAMLPAPPVATVFDEVAAQADTSALVSQADVQSAADNYARLMAGQLQRSE